MEAEAVIIREGNSMRARISDCIAVIGFALIVYGASLIYKPLGFLLAGAALVLIAHEINGAAE